MPEQNAGWWYLDRHLAEGRAELTCLLSGDDTLSYRDLHQLAAQVARVFTEAGLVPGDRIVLVLHDHPLAVAAILAALRIGAVAVPINPVLSIDEQDYVVTDSGARGVVVETSGGELAGRLASRDDVTVWGKAAGDAAATNLPDLPGLTELATAARPLPEVTARRPEDIAVIQYTSGTTGKPKGVVHRHRGLLRFPDGLGRALEMAAEDRCLSTAKLSFGYGFGNSLLLPLSAGAAAVLYPGRPEPHAIAGLLRTARPTVFFGVPTLYAALLAMPRAAERLDFSGVRLAVSAGEHLGATLRRKLFDTFGLDVVNGLGSTECLHIFLATLPGTTRRDTSGEPVAGFELEARDEAGNPVPSDEPGQLWVHGPSVADQYWNRPEETAATFRDGWVRTGDTVRYGPDSGWIYIGRSDDMLNVAGFKISPTELEEQVLKHPEVGSCAVVGIPDEDELTRIVVYAVPEPGVPEGLDTRLLSALRKALPSHKRPKVVRVVAELPRTSTGKIARFAVRRQELESTP
ncbi:benzoate-CoA ligase family protein [Amycolatopsis nigrescens]|uniref:benzoate-CoA ligase family protein n=1 Tax=Amycolatopsis nigrescens TaxID=381445 RepID=UPI000363217D|nr:benzoate-CoA ligase family protein [Amycolatopsis nigrescens]